MEVTFSRFAFAAVGIFALTACSEEKSELRRDVERVEAYFFENAETFKALSSEINTLERPFDFERCSHFRCRSDTIAYFGPTPQVNDMSSPNRVAKNVKIEYFGPDRLEAIVKELVLPQSSSIHIREDQITSEIQLDAPVLRYWETRDVLTEQRGQVVTAQFIYSQFDRGSVDDCVTSIEMAEEDENCFQALTAGWGLKFKIYFPPGQND